MPAHRVPDRKAPLPVRDERAVSPGGPRMGEVAAPLIYAEIDMAACQRDSC